VVIAAPTAIATRAALSTPKIVLFMRRVSLKQSSIQKYFFGLKKWLSRRANLKLRELVNPDRLKDTVCAF
jgi:hypothetical protein